MNKNKTNKTTIKKKKDKSKIARYTNIPFPYPLFNMMNLDITIIDNSSF